MQAFLAPRHIVEVRLRAIEISLFGARVEFGGKAFLLKVQLSIEPLALQLQLRVERGPIEIGALGKLGLLEFVLPIEFQFRQRVRARRLPIGVVPIALQAFLRQTVLQLVPIFFGQRLLLIDFAQPRLEIGLVFDLAELGRQHGLLQLRLDRRALFVDFNFGRLFGQRLHFVGVRHIKQPLALRQLGHALIDRGVGFIQRHQQFFARSAPLFERRAAQRDQTQLHKRQPVFAQRSIQPDLQRLLDRLARRRALTQILRGVPSDPILREGDHFGIQPAAHFRQRITAAALHNVDQKFDGALLPQHDATGQRHAQRIARPQIRHLEGQLHVARVDQDRRQAFGRVQRERRAQPIAQRLQRVAARPDEALRASVDQNDGVRARLDDEFFAEEAGQIFNIDARGEGVLNLLPAVRDEGRRRSGCHFDAAFWAEARGRRYGGITPWTFHFVAAGLRRATLRTKARTRRDLAATLRTNLILLEKTRHETPPMLDFRF